MPKSLDAQMNIRLSKEHLRLIEEAAKDVHSQLSPTAWVRELAVQAARESRARREQARKAG